MVDVVVMKDIRVGESEKQGRVGSQSRCGSEQVTAVGSGASVPCPDVPRRMSEASGRRRVYSLILMSGWLGAAVGIVVVFGTLTSQGFLSLHSGRCPPAAGESPQLCRGSQ